MKFQENQNQKFVKLLNDNLIHHGITYKEGKLIEDPNFNKTTECNNGLHFCRLDQIDKWINDFGGKIGIVNLEPDSKVIKFDDKYKTNKMKVTEIKWLWEHELFETIIKNRSVEICNILAKYGRINELKYAHENGCFWNKGICSYAACYGRINELKYLHEIGCPWDEWICASATENGHLDCLKYLHENGCPWHEWTCFKAAYYGHLNCLKYAYENGCPWDEWTCDYAAYNGQLDCLKYAIDNKCPNWEKYVDILKELDQLE